MIYKNLIFPLLRQMDPEKAHSFAMSSLIWSYKNFTPLFNMLPSRQGKENPRLSQKLWGMNFPHPFGLAAGFDKNGIALHPLSKLFDVSHIEIGGITMLEQGGNPLPRIFRLVEDEAIINRMGFNNVGPEKTADNLIEMGPIPVPLGLNVGKSKDTPIDKAEEDYCFTIRILGRFADYIVINVSSPNTADLRTLQEPERLLHLLQCIRREIEKLPKGITGRAKPLIVKIAPDLEKSQIAEILSVLKNGLVDGIAAINTTITRPSNLKTKIEQVGGLSGAPIRKRALEVVSYIREELPQMPIIGIGGLFTGEQVFAMIKAGANLVQAYTGFVYEGPFMARRAIRDLEWRLEDEMRTVCSYSPFVNRD